MGEVLVTLSMNACVLSHPNVSLLCAFGLNVLHMLLVGYSCFCGEHFALCVKLVSQFFSDLLSVSIKMCFM